mmetsp:Transcript_13702/g.25685  ORF Transcript_13702/g.25685 Transcript_13702/m.25685 type:complete len:408 (+) Transcript_13702:82-1305(+)
MAKVAVFVVSLFATVLPSLADLGSTVLRTRTPEPQANDPLVVRLQRVEGLHDSHFYVGKVFLGHPSPQEMQVLFDTASGHLLVPHTACRSHACKKHKRYSPWKSAKATDVNANGKPVKEGERLVKGQVTRDAVTVEFTQADLGEGAARAVLVHDDVCLGTEYGQKVCTGLDVMTAIKMDDELFEAMPYDGMLGLSMAGLSSGTGCVFFAQLMQSNPGFLPQFGLSLGAQSGEIFFGGHDSSRLAEPLRWFPVLHPDDGFWEVAVKQVRLGNLTLDACQPSCRGIVDTGASRLGVQEENFEAVRAALARGEALVGGGCKGADLEFDLGELTLKLRAEDYLAGAACTPQLGSLSLDPKEYHGVYAFGESVLRRYYAAFDWQGKRIGFAPVAQRRVALGGSSSSLPILTV